MISLLHFQEFFQVSRTEREKLLSWLSQRHLRLVQMEELMCVPVEVGQAKILRLKRAAFAYWCLGFSVVDLSTEWKHIFENHYNHI